MDGLRLMLFDRTCRGRRGLPGLSHAWGTGGALYAAFRRVDGYRGADSWRDALRWLAEYRPEHPIAEIQFWGHGKWGDVRIGTEVLDAGALDPGHEHHAALAAVRERLVGPRALWWFRTCETFGCEPGHAFARRWTDYFDCRAAGHTFIIGFWQSGLHSLSPGQRPDWPTDEGLVEGTPQNPARAAWSSTAAPNTISCLRADMPVEY